MDMAEARTLPPGTPVVYRATPRGPFEDGEVVGVGKRVVFVLYRGDVTPKATYPEDLEVRDTMTPDEVLAEFAKLPLPQKMRAAVDVVEEAQQRHNPLMLMNPSVVPWDAQGLRINADYWEAEDAKAADRERIAEELADAINRAFCPDGSWSVSTLRANRAAAASLLDRFPHIAEGWPKA